MLVPQPVVLGSSSAQTTVVSGNLTVCGNTSFPGSTALQSLAVGTGGITDAGPLTVQGATVLNNTVNVAGALSSASSLSAAGAVISGSATTPGGAYYGYNGSAVTSANFPNGLFIATAPAPSTASITSGGAILAQSAELIGDLVVRGAYVGSNGTVRQPASFPLGATLAAPLSSTSSLSCQGAVVSGSATNVGGDFLGYNGTAAVAANLSEGAVIPQAAGGGGVRLGTWGLIWGNGSTASDGGVTFTPPASMTGYNGILTALGTVSSGTNVLVENNSSVGSLRLVCVSPGGTPAGAGIVVTALFIVGFAAPY